MENIVVKNEYQLKDIVVCCFTMVNHMKTTIDDWSQLLTHSVSVTVEGPTYLTRCDLDTTFWEKYALALKSYSGC